MFMTYKTRLTEQFWYKQRPIHHSPSHHGVLESCKLSNGFFTMTVEQWQMVLSYLRPGIISDHLI